MEVFLGGALIVAWVIVLLWAMAKTAARALRGDQFNSGLGSLTDRFTDHLSQVFRLRFFHAGTICRGRFRRL
jgi:hypothetical protein